MPDVKVIGPGFISITVSDVQRSAAFYEQQLGAVRDPYDFGPTAVAFYGWPAFSVSAPRPASPVPRPTRRRSRSGGGRATRRRSSTR